MSTRTITSVSPHAETQLRSRGDFIRKASVRLALKRTQELVRFFRFRQSSGLIDLGSFAKKTKEAARFSPINGCSVKGCGVVGCVAGHAVLRFAPDNYVIASDGSAVKRKGASKEIDMVTAASRLIRADLSSDRSIFAGPGSTAGFDTSYTDRSTETAEQREERHRKEALNRLIRHEETLKAVLRKGDN